MKKLLSLVFLVFVGILALTGCSEDPAPFTEKTYAPENEAIRSVSIDVRDRAVEIVPSADGKIRIDYFENTKEGYDFTVSADNVLTVTAATDKEWTDYIGSTAPADVRKITLYLPDAMLENLSVSTTNEDIAVAPLTLCGDVSLRANGGNIRIGTLAAEDITLDVKNGSISGTVSGSYDDYAITCTVKKGDTNLPESKEGGSKKLTVTANNGDVELEIG